MTTVETSAHLNRVISTTNALNRSLFNERKRAVLHQQASDKKMYKKDQDTLNKLMLLEESQHRIKMLEEENSDLRRKIASIIDVPTEYTMTLPISKKSKTLNVSFPSTMELKQPLTEDDKSKVETPQIDIETLEVLTRNSAAIETSEKNMATLREIISEKNRDIEHYKQLNKMLEEQVNTLIDEQKKYFTKEQSVEQEVVLKALYNERNILKQQLQEMMREFQAREKLIRELRKTPVVQERSIEDERLFTEQKSMIETLSGTLRENIQHIEGVTIENARLLGEVERLRDLEASYTEMPGDRILERTIEVPIDRIVEVPVEKIVERLVEVPVEIEKIIEVEKIVEVPIEVPVEVEVERVIEVPVEIEVEKIVEKIVEVPVERIVEKIVYMTSPESTQAATPINASIESSIAVESLDTEHLHGLNILQNTFSASSSRRSTPECSPVIEPNTLSGLLQRQRDIEIEDEPKKVELLEETITIDEHMRQIKTIDAIRDAIQLQLDEALLENDSLTERVTVEESDKEKLADEVQFLTNENRSLRERVSILQSRFDGLTMELTAAKDQVLTFDAVKMELKKTKHDFGQKLMESRQLMGQLEDMAGVRNALYTDLTRLKSAYDDLLSTSHSSPSPVQMPSPMLPSPSNVSVSSPSSVESNGISPRVKRLIEENKKLKKYIEVLRLRVENLRAQLEERHDALKDVIDDFDDRYLTSDMSVDSKTMDSSLLL
ncbi:hypothetical protein PCE1_001093 [Barthelona sp. PCE]